MTPLPSHFILWDDGQLTPTNQATANKFHCYKLAAQGLPATAELLCKFKKQRPDLFPAVSTNVEDY